MEKSTYCSHTQTQDVVFPKNRILRKRTTRWFSAVQEGAVQHSAANQQQAHESACIALLRCASHRRDGKRKLLSRPLRQTYVSNKISRWWWYVVLYFVSALIILIPFPSDDIVSLADLPVHIALIILISGFPTLGLCLFIDAMKVNRATTTWKPNAYFYGTAGVIQGVSLFGDFWFSILGVKYIWSSESLSSDPFRLVLIVVSAAGCLFYLFQRFRHVGFR